MRFLVEFEPGASSSVRSLVARIVIPWRQILFARSIIADVDSAD